MAVLGAAVAGGLFLLSFILWLHEQDIHPLRTVTARIVRRPWFEALLLLFCIGGFVRYGATKGTNGTEDVNRQLQGLMMSSAPVVVPDAVDSTGFSLPADFPPVTNLCFWGIERVEDTVSLGLAWPETWSFPADAVDLFGNWRLATNGWFHLARIDISSAQSNAVVHLASADFPTNAMASSAFFQAADRTDSDADGLTDAYERLVSGSSPAVADSDGDGIADGDESSLGIDPTAGDSDGDGISDGVEIGLMELMSTADTYWQPMSNEHPVWSSTSYSDYGSYVIDLPRPYTVNGVTYSQVRICADGVVYLLDPERPSWWWMATFWDPPSLSDTALCESHVAIAAFCDDLYIDARNWGSWAVYGTANLSSGSASVIDFYSIGFESDRYVADQHLFSYQLVLPSGEPNVFYLTYRPMRPSEYYASRNPTIGVQCPMLSPVRSDDQYYNLTWKPTAEFFGSMRRIKFTIGRGTDPASSDSDGDGFSDSDEIFRFLTDPNVPDGDADADGLPDATELRIGTDPGLDDTDCDGISDSEEFSIGTNPLQPDTDNDGMNDGWERRHDGAIVEWLPANGLLMAPSGTSVPFDPLVNNDEDSDPNNDSDADPDGDGLTNAEECAMGLNPCRPDTDGDGIDDPTEIGQGSDPSDPSDEGRPGSRVDVSFYFGDHSGSHSEKYRLSVVPVRGQGTRPSSFSWLNERFGECETKTAFLKPGWRYEVRLSHGGTKPNESTDYDYTLRQTGVLPSNVVITDADSLFGVDETSSSFAGAGKVAYMDVYKAEVCFADPDDADWSEIDESRVYLDNENVRIRIRVYPRAPDRTTVTGVFGDDVTVKTSGTKPQGASLSLTDADQFVQSSGYSELRMSRTFSQLKSAGLLPAQDEDGITERCAHDEGMKVDSEAFFVGNAVRRGWAIGASAENLFDNPPVAIPSFSFFRAAGAEVIRAEFCAVTAMPRQVMNQANVFYYSGHGSSASGKLKGPNGSRFELGPDVVDGWWNRELKCVVFSACSVLDINDYNNNHNDPTFQHSHGKEWERVGPPILLGYNGIAPGDSGGATTRIVSEWNARRSAGDIDAWMAANRANRAWNACAIERGVRYVYFKRLLWGYHNIKTEVRKESW